MLSAFLSLPFCRSLLLWGHTSPRKCLGQIGLSEMGKRTKNNIEQEFKYLKQHLLSYRPSTLTYMIYFKTKQRSYSSFYPAYYFFNISWLELIVDYRLQIYYITTKSTIYVAIKL